MARTLSISLLAALSFLVLPCVATAQISFAGPLDPGQEVPPVTTSSASGYGCYTLNPDSTLSFTISYSGLSSSETGAHFHGPAAAGVGAGVQMGLPAGNPKVGTTAQLSAAQYNDVVNGLWYANIHTQNNTGGEIRGQVVQGPCDPPVAVEDTTWEQVKVLFQ